MFKLGGVGSGGGNERARQGHATNGTHLRQASGAAGSMGLMRLMGKCRQPVTVTDRGPTGAHQSPITSPLSRPITPDPRRFRIHSWAKVTEKNEVFHFARVFKGHAGSRGGFTAEHFVVSQFHKADQVGGIQNEVVHFASSLHDSQTIRAIVTDGAFYSGLEGELFCRKELFAVDVSVNDPAIHITIF